MDTSEGTAASSGYRDSRGRFTKGTTGNPKGRPKTPPNEQDIKDLLLAIYPEIITRLLDLVHSDNEAIALHAAIVLRDWYFAPAQLNISKEKLTSISMTYGENPPCIKYYNSLS